MAVFSCPGTYGSRRARAPAATQLWPLPCARAWSQPHRDLSPKGRGQWRDADRLLGGDAVTQPPGWKRRPGSGVRGRGVPESGRARMGRRRRDELPRPECPSGDSDQAAGRRRRAGRRREPPWAWRPSAAPRAPAACGSGSPPTTLTSVRLRGRPRPARAFLPTPRQPPAPSQTTAPVSRPGSHSRRPS